MSAPLALTQGDPSGVGVEIALKCWLARDASTMPFFLLANPDHVARVAVALGLNVPVRSCSPAESAAHFATALPVVTLANPVVGAPGTPDPRDAPATLEAIERAVACVRAGEASAVVTNPIAKEPLYRAGFNHPGHTEWLGELAERGWNTGPLLPVMLLWSPMLAVVPVTIHLSLSHAVQALDADSIVRVGLIAADGLKTLFGIDRPRIAIAGLNPHAGEQGAMGDEESRIIAPAIARLKAEGIDVRGPAPADTLFHPAARATYDAALCMYHDQALIPIKTIDFSGGVNVTVGLPFVRTSPDHGTALDIAGTGRADPASLLAALAMADDMARRRGA